MIMEDPACAIGLNLQGRRVVFAGAGPVAEQKLLRLLGSGAKLTVISRACTPAVEKLAAEGRITLERRGAGPEDFAGTLLAFLGTEEHEASSAELAAAARSRGALVNRGDAPHDCDFVLPALTWMNTVHIGVFSESPSLSRWVRRHLEQTLGPEFPEFMGFFGEIRTRVRESSLSSEVRAELLSRLLNEGLYHTYRTDGMRAARTRAEQLLKEYEARHGQSPGSGKAEVA